MKKTLFSSKNIFLLIIALSIFLRFFKLGSVPPELNRDEASLGYTAYSILKTGHEEHGKYWPVQIESFGDWKLPLYIYTLIPFITVFNLEPWVVRLPSALAGIGIVVVSRFLILQLFRENKYKDKLAVLVPLLLAISPWEIHFSHVAYEAHLSLFFFILGLLGILIVRNKLIEQKIFDYKLLTISILSCVITLLGYHAYQVFIPLFLIGLAVLSRSEINQLNKAYGLKQKLIPIIPIFLIGSLLLISGVNGANKTKFSGLSIFNLSSYSNEVSKERVMLESPNNLFFVGAINKGSAFLQKIQANFFDLISPDFIFTKGGVNGAHNITGFGNLYPILFFGLVVGLAQIIISTNSSLNILGIWILAAAVAPMITFTANHTTRFSPVFLSLEILSVYGYLVIFDFFKNKLSGKLFKLFITIFAIGLSYSAYYFLIHYFFIFPHKDAVRWSWQMKPLVFQLDAIKNNYDKVIVQDEQSSPYIYFLFYLKIDPLTLSKRMEYYPIDSEGFRHVKRLDNIYFEKINWEITNYLEEGRLFVISDKEIPDYNRYHERFSLLTSLENEYVEQKIELWEYEPFH